METINLYKAEYAKRDSSQKETDIKNFIDDDKILLILSAIKAYILSIKPQSKQYQYVSREFPYNGHLSIGEIKYLEDLGYEVEYIDSQRESVSYFNITWKNLL